MTFYIPVKGSSRSRAYIRRSNQSTFKQIKEMAKATYQAVGIFNNTKKFAVGTPSEKLDAAVGYIIPHYELAKTGIRLLSSLR